MRVPYETTHWLQSLNQDLISLSCILSFTEGTMSLMQEYWWSCIICVVWKISMGLSQYFFFHKIWIHKIVVWKLLDLEFFWCSQVSLNHQVWHYLRLGPHLSDRFVSASAGVARSLAVHCFTGHEERSLRKFWENKLIAVILFSSVAGNLSVGKKVFIKGENKTLRKSVMKSEVALK